MRLFNWVIRRLAFLCIIGLGIVGIWQCAPSEDQILKSKVVAAIAPAEKSAFGYTLSVDMARAANFPWDTLYMFTSTSTVEGISAAIGTPWPGSVNVDEDDNLMVFMYKGKLANYVSFRGFNYQQEPNFVKFIGHFNSGELFTPATAKFRATRDKSPPNFIHLYHYHRMKPTVVYRPAFGKYLTQYRQVRNPDTPEPPLPK